MLASRLSRLKLKDVPPPEKETEPGGTSDILQCPICDNRMSLQSERSLPPRDGVDFTLRAFRCDDCGMASGLAFNPAFGYDRKATAMTRFNP